jgi:hypothetical protein
MYSYLILVAYATQHYRNFVLYTLPGIEQFDLSPVTNHQREMIAVWALTYRKQLNPDHDED